MPVQVPIYYRPRPYQQAAWRRELSGEFDFYLKIWHRQAGKDSDDIELALNNGWRNPGTQSAYVGLDNKWTKRNVWDKYLDGRTHFANYPDDQISVNATQQQVKFLNNPTNLSPALLQFIGFKESESLIGSSYNFWYISELSLYKRGAFDFIQPIWDSQKANGVPLMVHMNFTPRGLNNGAADWLRALTKEDEPEKWPGPHGRVYVDWLPATMSEKAPGVPLYTPEHLEAIRQRYIRLYGNDQLFRQEMLCEFLAVNAGLVFPTIEALRKEGRFCPCNLDTSKPVYMAWDISSKDKTTDWTSCVVFQYYNGKLFIYDWYENNRKAVVECVQELASRPYFHLIREACLPWDSDRSGSSQSPLDECRRMFPNITWHKLDRTYVADSINNLRTYIPNTIINSDKCDWLMECFENWEYRELTSIDDWSAEPKHDRYSHLMDACRYAGDMLKQIRYLSNNSGEPLKMPSKYKAWDLDGEDEETSWDDMPPGMRPSKFSNLRNKKPKELYGSYFDI